MCTVTWLTEDAGYRLFFNRDERRRRLPALPPSLRERGGVRWIAPTDGDAGGSWIAANEFGVTVFLLNGYTAGDSREPAAGWISRGRLVDDVAIIRAVDALESHLRNRNLARYRSFWLAALGPGGEGTIGKWCGGGLTIEALRPTAMPLVSSSFETAAVSESRVALFTERVPRPATADDHLAYHASHEPAPGPYSVCMHRPDAQTVSFSCIAVDATEVCFRYAPHAPHEGLPAGPALTLGRRSAVS